MFATIFQIKRDNLYKEIISEFRQWPELERTVFSQVHYGGQSMESIARSLQLDVDSVNAILKRCDHRLHASLRSLCEGTDGMPSPAQIENAAPLPGQKNLKAALDRTSPNSTPPIKKKAL